LLRLFAGQGLAAGLAGALTGGAATLKAATQATTAAQIWLGRSAAPSMYEI